MTNERIELLGSWITAIGTIASAIGSTPLRRLQGEDKKKWDDISEQLDFGGNALQAIGNIVEVAGTDEFTLEVAGEIIQASGNVTVLFSILTEDNEVKKINLNIVGNAQQAFGGFLAVIDEIGDIIEQGGGDPTNALGNLLQSIGNTLQAIGGLYDLEIIREKEALDIDGDGETEVKVSEESVTDPLNEQIKINGEISELLKYSGSWIQAAGSIMTAVAERRVLAKLEAEKRELENKKKKKRKKNKKRTSSHSESKKIQNTEFKKKS
ncbi:DUF6944 family repetitive protein [Gottfriedia solisilvae]|uniref:Uncharacterized protein n=1 Tax=Gottfriedia solisilvae TaxID=1516104 RepID=A0A8J3AJD2_9BACI|nr:hypothetical protein [Gottfriedia solisilvae]GGI14905.1 hypothetical protein GCM10007380_25290 [Gottfriedia solisilvae]